MKLPSSADMMNTFNYAIANPFGLDFGSHDIVKNDKTQSVPYVTLGSVINCIGYNDYLERVVGVTRVFLGLMALAFCRTSENKTKEAVVAALHIFRGILETMGNFERELLIADVAFTIFNLAGKSQFFQPAEKTV